MEVVALDLVAGCAFRFKPKRDVKEWNFSSPIIDLIRVRDLADWASYLHDKAIDTFRKSADLFDKDTRYSSLMLAAAGSIPDPYSKLIDTVEGKAWIVDRCFARLNPSLPLPSITLEIEEFNDLALILFCRSGLLYPKDQEEATMARMSLPPKQDFGGNQENQIQTGETS